MTQLKDNRVDNFCKVFDFEYDSNSRLWLPEGSTWTAPSLKWSAPALPYYGTAARVFSNDQPQDLTSVGLETILAKLRDRHDEAILNRLKPENPSLRYYVGADFAGGEDYSAWFMMPTENETERDQNQTWCPHVGGVDPPFPFCDSCESTVLGDAVDRWLEANEAEYQ